jgi:hypothetical protein
MSQTGKDTGTEASIKFGQMNVQQKLLHLLKVVIFLGTFGFAFPNIIEDF